jgi:hypothetical protein
MNDCSAIAKAAMSMKEVFGQIDSCDIFKSHYLDL